MQTRGQAGHKVAIYTTTTPLWGIIQALTKVSTKMCLCRNTVYPAIDMALAFLTSINTLYRIRHGLIVPSFILILLLAGAFYLHHYYHLQQKSLAELKNRLH